MPIIGRGDIARALRPHNNKNALFFASGVSKSTTSNIKEFKREEELLIEMFTTHYNKCLFYFSSINIDADTPYMQHKRNMEVLIKKIWTHYYIIRLGNIWWGKNRFTFINFITDPLRKVDFRKVRWKEKKYVIYRDDFVLIAYLPLKGKHTINIFSECNTVRYFIDKRYKQKDEKREIFNGTRKLVEPPRTAMASIRGDKTPEPPST